MSRLLFEKKGSAIWISHLDLMRLFQRAFKRANLPLKHTQGFNPRPSVSIALPLSVGVESSCELLDFELEGQTVSCDEIVSRLNAQLVSGIQVLDAYEDGRKIKHLGLLDCTVTLEYDLGVPNCAVEKITNLFAGQALLVEKKGKNGTVRQDIIPMIKGITVARTDNNTITISALICCQEPTLNPAQLTAAIQAYLPEYRPDFAYCKRNEIYDREETVFR